jgi:hypothetical protein
MMEAVRTSETLVDNHFTRHYIPEDNSEGESSVSFIPLHLFTDIFKPSSDTVLK